MTYFVTELSVATEIEDEPFNCSKAREARYSHAKMYADTGHGECGGRDGTKDCYYYSNQILRNISELRRARQTQNAPVTNKMG